MKKTQFLKMAIVRSFPELYTQKCVFVQLLFSQLHYLLLPWFLQVAWISGSGNSCEFQMAFIFDMRQFLEDSCFQP